MYMRLQAIRMYSARDACRADAGKFTHFYRYTAGNACKLRVGPFYMRTEDEVTCLCRVIFTHLFYSVNLKKSR